MLTQEMIKSVLSYCPETGIFTWLKRPGLDHPTTRWNAKHAGKPAGSISAGHGWAIKIARTKYQAARVAWIYVHGKIPRGKLIDHRNGDRLDNRLENLRLATPTQNAMNRPAHCTNASGYKGVHRYHNRYIAQIQVEGKKLHLGIFLTPELAAQAYEEAASVHFGVFSGHLSR